MFPRPTVLFVCHANICRSPIAERLGRGLAGDRLEFRSAGTHALPGRPMHPGAAEALREAGADPTAFASRPVTPALLTGAALVLTAGREQRAACVALCPGALSRTFTIRQFARLTRAVAPERVTGAEPGRRLGALLAEVALVRGGVQPVPPADDAVVDPVNGTADDLRACVRLIQASLTPWLSLVDR